MDSVPANFTDLCGAPHFGHIATVNADGSPTISPVWIMPASRNDDGSVPAIWFSTGLRFRKSLNMQREPRVSITVHDTENPYRTLEVIGIASLEHRPNWDGVDEISHTYLGVDYPYKEGTGEGYNVTVAVERAVCSGDFQAPPFVAKPEPGTDLLMPPHFAHVATVGPTGQPRASVVWHRRAAGGGEDDIEFWTGRTTVKARHLSRNPAVAASIHDEANGGRYTELRGRAAITEVDNHNLLDELTPHYWQLDRYPSEGGEPMQGVVVRVNTERRVSMG